jgi:hypothetical protein
MASGPGRGTFSIRAGQRRCGAGAAGVSRVWRCSWGLSCGGGAGTGSPLPAPREARLGTAHARLLEAEGSSMRQREGAIPHRTHHFSARDRPHPAYRWRLACPSGNSFSTDRLRGVSALGAIPYLGGTSLPEGSRPCDERSAQQ